jgi:purine-cytosine permease-like protein
VLFTKHSDKIKGAKIGATSSMHGRDEKCTQNLTERYKLGDIGADVSTILKWI